MTYNSKYSNLNNWIKKHIKPSELEVFDNNTTKCEYVFSKIPTGFLDEPIKLKQLYQLLYKMNYISSNVFAGNGVNSREAKNQRLNWIIEHQKNILDINLANSKLTNNARIEYTFNHLNQDLKTQYTISQIRNFLTNQNLLSKYYNYYLNIIK